MFLEMIFRNGGNTRQNSFENAITNWNLYYIDFHISWLLITLAYYTFDHLLHWLHYFHIIFKNIDFLKDYYLFFFMY